MEPKIPTFFYGSYMNLAVLGEVDLTPDQVEVARLPGFDIRIQPLANLVPSDRHTLYGILAAATHRELERLYAHARDVLGGIYLPHPVLAHTRDGRIVPALCYIAPAMDARPAANEYIDRILQAARRYDFPAWYVERVESFRAAPMPYRLRKATLGDQADLERVIALSARTLDAGDYTPEQIEGALRGAFGVDTELIVDGTYLVAECGGRIVGCGGWSRRRTLFGGDRGASRDSTALDPRTEPARIRAFFVDPAHARRGIARALLTDLLRTDLQGRGVVNILAADQLILKPRLFSSFLLWLLSELFENLPEVGDLDRPRLVFVFDEAHLLFDDAPPALRQQVEQVVRIIRSRGVGVYLCSQFPDDVPSEILGQLGNRIQHALRAYTPRDQKAVRTAAETFVRNPRLDVAEAIARLGVGEALVSTLQEKAVPMPVERTLMCPPRCRMGAITSEERAAVRARSPVGAKYDARVNRESAYEILNRRTAPADGSVGSPRTRGEQPSEGGGQLGDLLWGTKRRQGMVEAMAKQAARTVGSQIGRQILRGVLGGILGGPRGR